MSKKLQGNGLWESSRLILPEHRSAINQVKVEESRRVRKNLDEQEQERIGQLLYASLMLKEKVNLRMFHAFKSIELSGIVQSVDVHQGYFKLNDKPYQIRDIEVVYE